MAGTVQFPSNGSAAHGYLRIPESGRGPELARKLERQLQGLGLSAEFFAYPGTRHAFFNDDRPEDHDPKASKLAWQRTVEFLRTRLTGSEPGGHSAVPW